jgi:hypothetical protein
VFIKNVWNDDDDDDNNNSKGKNNNNDSYMFVTTYISCVEPPSPYCHVTWTKEQFPEDKETVSWSSIATAICYLCALYLSIYLCVCLSFYGSIALVDLGRLFTFLIYTQSIELLGRGISPPQGRYLHTEEHKHRINAHRHPCLEFDSNPRSQRSSGRRRFMPRPLWWAPRPLQT